MDWEALSRLLSTTHVPRPSGNCGFVDCEPGWIWNPSITDHDLWVVVSGRGSASIAGQAITLRPGSALVLRPGDTGIVRQDPADRLTVVYCHFDFTGGDRTIATLPAERLPARHVRLSPDATVAHDLHRVVTLVRDRHSLAPLQAGAALLGVLLEVYREDARAEGDGPRNDVRVQKVVERIRREPGLRLSLDDAAAAADLSPVHFSRLFRRAVGVSFREFVLENRLERARHLLTESPLPVGRIARMLGYADPYLFSRQVRRRYGLSPSKLRRA